MILFLVLGIALGSACKTFKCDTQSLVKTGYCAKN